MCTPRRVAALLLFAGSLHAGPATPLAAQAPPSIRAIESAPFPTAMVRSLAGTAVAWVQNAEGARSIWVAEAPQYTANRVANFAADDGQELSDLAFSADARTLWFTRGSGTNRAGENPNPSSDPLGAEQAIWRVDLAANGTAARRMTDGSRATPAPAAFWHPALDPKGFGAFSQGRRRGAAPQPRQCKISRYFNELFCNTEK